MCVPLARYITAPFKEYMVCVGDRGSPIKDRTQISDNTRWQVVGVHCFLGWEELEGYLRGISELGSDS